MAISDVVGNSVEVGTTTPEKVDYNDSNFQNYVLVVSGCRQFIRDEQFPPCEVSMRVVFEVMISDLYKIAEEGDIPRVELLEDFSFYSVDGPSGCSSRRYFKMNDRVSRFLGKKNKGLVGFCYDNEGQAIVFPEKRMVFPYAAKRVFPFKNFRATPQRIEELAEDAELLFQFAARVVLENKPHVTDIVPVEEHVCHVPQDYRSYILDPRPELF